MALGIGLLYDINHEKYDTTSLFIFLYLYYYIQRDYFFLTENKKL